MHSNKMDEQEDFSLENNFENGLKYERDEEMGGEEK